MKKRSERWKGSERGHAEFRREQEGRNSILRWAKKGRNFWCEVNQRKYLIVSELNFGRIANLKEIRHHNIHTVKCIIIKRKIFKNYKTQAYRHPWFDIIKEVNMYKMQNSNFYGRVTKLPWEKPIMVMTSASWDHAQNGKKLTRKCIISVKIRKYPCLWWIC